VVVVVVVVVVVGAVVVQTLMLMVEPYVAFDPGATLCVTTVGAAPGAHCVALNVYDGTKPSPVMAVLASASVSPMTRGAVA
jgi:hypothetical protein